MRLPTLLCLTLLPAVLDAQPRTPTPRPLRVLVIRDGPADGKTPAGFLSRDRRFAPAFRPAEELSAEALGGAEAVLLEDPGASLDGGRLRALSGWVRAGGAAVLGPRAAVALPASREFSRFIGRRSLGGGTDRADIAVAVRDQRHPITQSVTHFLHRGELRRLDVDPDAEVLAAAIPARASAHGEAGTGDEGGGDRAGAGPATESETPVLWIARRGRGTVIVSALDRRTGPSQPLVAALLARALQWGAGRFVTVPIEGDFRPAASALGADDTGLVAGRPPAPGFYRGRKIAPVMSYLGAAWLTRADRERTELPERVVASLGLRAGQQVADLGAGVGYFTLRLARAVGAEGRVYAVDIQKEMLDILEKNVAKSGLRNIVPVLCTETDPGLAARSIDLVLMVDVYHELSRPREVMDAVRAALADGGRVVLVEYRGEDPTVPIKPLHRMTVAQARAELEGVGFRLLEVKHFLPRQHVLVFGRKEKQDEKE